MPTYQPAIIIFQYPYGILHYYKNICYCKEKLVAELSLKNKALRGMIWNAIETIALQGGQFIFGIVLARLLSPSDYGLVGMLAIFIAISQTFVDSGMGNALIQKKNRTDVDFSTVFVFNIIVSALFYLVLSFSAPYIAAFYKMPQLVLLTRILSLNFVINSLALVQNTRLTISMDFKTKAKVSAISVVLSGTIAIILAYYGFGVWALVFQTLSRAIVSVSMLWYLSRWKPSFVLSRKSFKDLFHFGSRILGASVISTIFQNIYKIVIGKAFSARELGFYSQAMNIAELTSGSITGILQTVTYPVLTSLQDEKERMIAVYKKLIGMTTFFVFPLMTLLALLAKPFVLLFLTEKWSSTIILLQWLCFARIVRPVSALNMNILNAIGRSDLFLKVDMSKIPLAVIALIITIPLGVKAIVIGHVVTSFISYFINAYLPGRFFGYGAFSQIKDMIKVIIAVLVMTISVYISSLLLESNALKFFVGGFIGVVSYIIAALLLKMEETKEVINLIKMISSKR
jgi:teichuronic acid exporter